MIEIIHYTSNYLKALEFDTVLDILKTLVIVIGTIIAVFNLRIIAKRQQLESVREFLKDLLDTSEDRKFVIRDFDFSLHSPPLSEELEKKVRNVINLLNRIGLLIESNLLPPKIVFGLSHTLIIRCWYKLHDYITFQESRIGGRYGRRIERMALRAKLYQDINPYHRATKIRIDLNHGREPTVIYETSINSGLKGLWQRIIWFLRRIFRVY